MSAPRGGQPRPFALHPVTHALLLFASAYCLSYMFRGASRLRPRGASTPP